MEGSQGVVWRMHAECFLSTSQLLSVPDPLGTGKNSTPQCIGKFDAFMGGEGKWVFSPWYRLIEAAAYCLLKKRGICVYSSSKSPALETSVCLLRDGMRNEKCWQWAEHLNHFDSSVFPQLYLAEQGPWCSLCRAFFPVHPSPCWWWRSRGTQLASLLRLVRYWRAVGHEFALLSLQHFAKGNLAPITFPFLRCFTSVG